MLDDGIIPPEIIVMIGVPSGGKSTWAASHKLTNPDKNYVVISSDRELYEIGLEQGLTDKHGRVGYTDVYPRYQAIARERVINKLKQYLSEGRNIILDRTHTAREERTDILRLVPAGYVKKAIIMDTPLAIVLKRWQINPKGVRNIDLKRIAEKLRADPVIKEEGFDNITCVIPDVKARNGVISPSQDAQKFTSGEAARRHPEWYDLSMFDELIKSEQRAR